MTVQIKVKVLWRTLGDDDDDGWDMRRCLYAYLGPEDDEVLYIGKAWGVTVHGRWKRASKEHFWDDLESERGIMEHVVLLGEISLSSDHRLSSELLADIESLLIQRVSPWGNIQSINTRISRPGLTVRCLGDWPYPQEIFRDS